MKTALQRKDYYLLLIVILVTLIIFFPIFSARYLYTDECLQLWAYKPGTGFKMFIDQGRLITEWMFIWLFGAIDKINEVTYIRVFSLAGWLLCLPLWYIILKKGVAKEPAYQYLPFFTCLYLVTSLPFGVTIQWASCLELWLANTSGLAAGALVYNAVQFNGKKIRIRSIHALAGLILGIISLFTYQTGLGCLLIPFLLHYISPHSSNKDRVIIAGMICFFLVYALYFPLFKLSMAMNDLGHNDRTDIYIDPINKLAYFFSHPLERSFWFNANVYEYSKVARALYKVMLIGWMVLAFVRFGKEYGKAIKYILVVLGVFLLAYFPGLIVKENFASNRTMLALNICVWLVCLEMALYFIKNRMVLAIGGVVVGLVLVITACYNHRIQFLKPVTDEYAALKKYIQQNYHPGINTIYVNLTPVDAFVKKYNIHQNMDEYGVPSSTFEWTMIHLPKQLVWEITGSRKTAEQLSVEKWDALEAFVKAGGDTTANNIMVVDPVTIINQQ
ncbi:hypothetical protein [Longitalea arenae]|uniref:hypothetical protein n=1 Tax=Longitalea arenae TaxID=2812558 RepID=UPI001968429A|nr:hypothetical protein [Longitalea arenae]